MAPKKIVNNIEYDVETKHADKFACDDTLIVCERMIWVCVIIERVNHSI
jgi:hypothetical protein